MADAANDGLSYPATFQEFMGVVSRWERARHYTSVRPGVGIGDALQQTAHELDDAVAIFRQVWTHAEAGRAHGVAVCRNVSDCTALHKCMTAGVCDRAQKPIQRPTGEAKTDSRCDYLAVGLCNKCGREHDGKGLPFGVPVVQPPSAREEAKKARPPSDEEPWVVADDEGVRMTFRSEGNAWNYRNCYTDRLTNPTVTYEPATAGVLASDGSQP